MIKKLLIASALFIGVQSNAQVEIYNEDFQNGIPMATYTIVDNDGLTPNATVSEFSDAWISLVDPDNLTDTIVGSTSYFEPTGQADRWLITPSITLGAYGNFVYWEAKSHDPSFPDDYLVLASRTDLQLSSFTDTVFNVINELETWQSRSSSLSDLGLDNETVFLAFVNRTNDGFKLYIDDIRVEMEDPVGLEENIKAKLTVYPNPSSDFVYVSGIKGITSIEVVSITGEKLLLSNTNNVDLSPLSSGRYVLIVKNDDTAIRTMVVKK